MSKLNNYSESAATLNRRFSTTQNRTFTDIRQEKIDKLLKIVMAFFIWFAFFGVCFFIFYFATLNPTIQHDTITLRGR